MTPRNRPEGARAAYSFGAYLGPARITWNCLHPRRGRWSYRFIWVRGLWRSWAVVWPTVSGFRLAARLRRQVEASDD